MIMADILYYWAMVTVLHAMSLPVITPCDEFYLV